MEIPWYGWIVGIGVSAWAFMIVFGTIGWSRRKNGTTTTTTLEENIATNKAVLEKLESIESIESRLGVVEKTLTDIP